MKNKKEPFMSSSKETDQAVLRPSIHSSSTEAVSTDIFNTELH